MPLRLNIILIIIAFVILFGIIELVVRRRLNEEYSFIWLLIGEVLLILALLPALSMELSKLFGTALPINTLFFLGILLILLLCLYFSLKLSVLTNRVKNLTQQIALLEEEMNDKKISR
jgi:hypothetical protein